MVNYERELQIDSTESRIIVFGHDFAENLDGRSRKKFLDEEIAKLT